MVGERITLEHAFGKVWNGPTSGVDLAVPAHPNTINWRTTLMLGFVMAIAINLKCHVWWGFDTEVCDGSRNLFISYAILYIVIDLLALACSVSQYLIIKFLRLYF